MKGLKSGNALLTSGKLRFTVIMVALALVTSVFAVGTLSKYNIGGSATDNAVVAQWGVTIDIEGTNSFAKQSSDGAIVSASLNKVVAPGTSSSEAKLDANDNNAGEMKVTLKGTPEVDFRLTIDLGTTEDVFLKGGENVTYPDYTSATTDASRGTFALEETYYPVVFTFTHYYSNLSYSLAGCMGNSGVERVSADTITGYANAEAFVGTLAQLDAFFENISAAMYHVKANYVLDDQFTLTWEWVFEGDNKADTVLGNLAADKTNGTSLFNGGLVDGEDYNLELAYQFTITIEQLDTVETVTEEETDAPVELPTEEEAEEPEEPELS